MKLVVIKSNFKTGLGAIERVSGEGLNLPILKNVLIEASDNAIRLTATNLEVATSYRVPGKVIENGKASVPLRVLSDVITNLQSERLNLEKKENSVEIKTENYSATLQGLSADDFPLVPKIKNQKTFLEISGGVLKEALAQVISSAQPSELRPELSSVLFCFSFESVKLVATDSFRLSEKTIPESQIKTNHEKEFKILIPLKTAQELMRILKEEESVGIYHNENQILFKTENFELISRLIEGNFPDYSAIIPKAFHAEITVNREEFIQALRLTGVFSTRANEVRVLAHENKKNIEIFSTDQALGENTYVLPAKNHGKTKEANFNLRYLLDGLRALKTEDAFLGMNEDNKPALLKAPGDASFFYILMPILKT